jgi:phospholipid transport system transporter-binding protein
MSRAELARVDDGGRYRVTGPMTFETAAGLAEQGERLAGSGQPLRLDLSAVEHVDSAGVAVLLDWLATARARKRELIFEAAPEQLVAIARVSGVETLLGLGRDVAGTETE